MRKLYGSKARSKNSSVNQTLDLLQNMTLHCQICSHRYEDNVATPNIIPIRVCLETFTHTAPPDVDKQFLSAARILPMLSYPHRHLTATWPGLSPRMRFKHPYLTPVPQSPTGSCEPQRFPQEQNVNREHFLSIRGWSAAMVLVASADSPLRNLSPTRTTRSILPFSSRRTLAVRDSSALSLTAAVGRWVVVGLPPFGVRWFTGKFSPCV